MDVADLREFYASPLGRTSAALISSALQPALKIAAGQTVLGLGYATPYLRSVVPPDAHAMAFMLARQGVTHWPRTGPVQSALVDEYDLPLLESTVDHTIMVHGLELADSPLDMLQEAWRVMAPQGKLYLVVPNRRGLWSASETSPFGFGRPFSRSQLAGLLKEAQFSPLNWRYALYTPPLTGRGMVHMARYLEKMGAIVMTRFAGVIVVEAVKQVYAFSSGKRSRRLVPRFKTVLLPSPQPSRREVTFSDDVLCK
jgi:SAM-dependent methyltransferase